MAVIIQCDQHGPLSTFTILQEKFERWKRLETARDCLSYAFNVKSEKNVIFKQCSFSQSLNAYVYVHDPFVEDLVCLWGNLGWFDSDFCSESHYTACSPLQSNCHCTHGQEKACYYHIKVQCNRSHIQFRWFSVNLVADIRAEEQLIDSFYYGLRLEVVSYPF